VIVNNTTNNNNNVVAEFLVKMPGQSQKVQRPEKTPISDSSRDGVRDDKQINAERIKERVKGILRDNGYLNNTIRLEIERDLDIIVTKILDKESDEVIRQIPHDKMIGIIKAIKEMLAKEGKGQRGFVVDEEV